MSQPIGVHISPEQEAELRRLIGGGMKPTHAARQIGVGDRSARRIAKKMLAEAANPKPSENPIVEEEAHEDQRHKLGGSAADREIIRLKDENNHLRQSLKEAHRQALDDDAIRILLGALSEAPVDPPNWLSQPAPRTGNGTAEVPVTIWSDWHMGEVVAPAEINGINAYGTEIAEARVKRLIDSTIHLCRKHGPKNYPGIVINLLGDFVSGGLHPELAKTDEEEILPTVLRCRDLLVAALRRMADEFGRVYCPATAGNHGRATQKPEFKRYVYKNFDWLIYQLLIREFADDPRVKIDVRPSNEVHYRVFGTRFLAMHGDMLGVKGGDGIIGSIGPIMRGEMKVGKQSAAIGRDYDVLLMGHWHQQLWLPRIIVANALKGFDEYAKNALRAPPSEPSQPLFFVHPRRRITSRWEVMVDEPKDAAAAEWVAVFADTEAAA